MPDFKIAKLGSRLVQPAIEDGDTSLLAKAFRTRLLDEAASDPALLNPLPQARVRVAFYEDPGVKLRTILRKIALTVIAPLIALFIIGFIVLSTINQPKPVVPIATESVVLSDVPVPAGVRPIQRATLYSPKQFIDVYLNQVLPSYTDDFKAAATYIGPKTQDELKDFYNTRLLQNKALGWQVYGKPTTYNISYTSLYVRALPSQVSGTIEALVVQFEPVDLNILRSDPLYYDSQTKPGEIAIILSKAWLVPRR
ncbi:MAG: hypothetical protein J0I20_10900 [Chloroflexi bacterium]|nr:hypothetical protein [Chloroflexota bacterium]OJV94415.1 MAG: hypothetical protein BGO39_21890 [Chloroflexi bacterium 54-19]